MNASDFLPFCSPYTTDKVPDLMQLIFAVNFKSYDTARWWFLGWMFGIDSSFTSKLRLLTKADHKFVPVMIAIRYLLAVS